MHASTNHDIIACILGSQTTDTGSRPAYVVLRLDNLRVHEYYSPVTLVGVLP